MAVKLVLGAVCGSAAIALGLLNPQVVSAVGESDWTTAPSVALADATETASWAAHPAVVSAGDIWQVLSLTHR